MVPSMGDDNIKWAEDAIATKRAKMQENLAENARLEAEIPDLEAYIRVERAKASRSYGSLAIRPSGQANPAISVPLTAVVERAAKVANPFLKLIADEQQKRGAKKRAILSILDSYNTALPTSTILTLLPAMKIAGATTENTSPQLSAYKADGFVTLVDEGWKITQKGREYLAQKN